MPDQTGVKGAFRMLQDAPADSLESTCYSLEYLSEGGANVVFRIIPATPEHHRSNPSELCQFSSAQPAALVGKLLRLTKATTPTTCVKIWEKHQFWANIFDQDEVVTLDLVELSETIVRACNQQLSQLEANSKRPKERRGQFLHEKISYGLLITDMSGELGRSYMIELKPKWLFQSPTAPSYSKRCRTCALRECRKYNKGAPTTPTDATEQKMKREFCPLALVSRDQRRLGRIVSRLVNTDDVLAKLNPDQRERVIDSLTRYLSEGRGAQILERLRDIQHQFDPVGILNFNPFEKDPIVQDRLCIAMTARDCSLLIRLPLTDTMELDQSIEGRLADLDPKSYIERIIQWSNTEYELLNGGWYLGKENSPAIESYCMMVELSASATPWHY